MIESPKNKMIICAKKIKHSPTSLDGPLPPSARTSRGVYLRKKKVENVSQ
jgi:hypothetical protein